MNGNTDTADRFIKKTLQDVAEKLQFKSFDITITDKFSKGENYLGEIRRATLCGVRMDGKKEELKLIVKTMPDVKKFMEEFPLNELYQNEAFMYNTYLPILLDLQNKAEIPDEDVTFKLAKCYLASSCECEEILIFEDMNEKGYAMHDRFKSFDSAHLKYAARVLACFHALAYAAKEKIPKETYSEYVNKLFLIKEHEQFTEYIKSSASNIGKYMDSEETRRKFDEYMSSDFLEDHRRVMYCDKERPYNIIAHGDFWINNFLFRYSDGKPDSIVMLDWQIVKYTTPVIDLIYLLYICIDEKTREENYDDVLRLYYETLKRRLIALDCDPEKCFPEAALYSEMKHFHRFALINSMIMLPLILNKKEDSVDLNDIMEGGAENYANVVKHTDVFKQRINGIVRHLTALNII